jgi:DnaJ like chaperone protein
LILKWDIWLKALVKNVRKWPNCRSALTAAGFWMAFIPCYQELFPAPVADNRTNPSKQGEVTRAFFIPEAVLIMWKIILPALLAILYSLSPYDVLPDFILGWGWVDDAIVLWFLWRYLKKLKERSAWSRNEYGQTRSDTSGSGPHEEENPSGTGSNRQKAPKDPCSILGVNHGASTEEIKKAYRHLANQYHPDKLAHLGEEFRVLAESRFKEIQQAYQTLISRTK